MQAYSTALAAPSMAVVGLTPYHRIAVPVAPAARANSTAARGLTSFLTRGLLRVRLILASWLVSNSIFSVLAHAIVLKVPVVRNSRVKLLSEGVCVAAVESREGTGYSEYEAVVVRTTRKARRGLVRERYVAMRRRREAGAA